MPIKGLFNRNENNDEEIQKLTKRVQTLEQQVKKINSIDVHMNRLLKLESKWKKETISSQYDYNERNRIPKRSDKETTKKREAYITVDEHFLTQLSKFISETLAPIQSKVNSLDERLAVMEGHFAIMEGIIEENRQQTIELKDELEKLKKNSIPKKDEQSVVIREIKVDKILLDKYEQNNNFGSLGIKDLGGQLNIGATYGSSTLPTEIAEDLKADFESFKQENEDKEDAGDESSVEDSEESSWQSSEESNERFSEHQDAREQKRVIDDNDDFTEISIE
ncbi:MAG TPA: hypothetical protein DEO65_04785 [Bacillus bacterium]|uniref:Uncharacterized protein n=1 Tax=Siminovitchia fordii TaxID=254759 RepID=A0ABQ4K394_9BACI|nr:hypothetical protein [Siminovitchia fordii]GIN20111.1 hypothetical protein J1TS3_12450 [Siminovitchia fordii]HBZ09189.1 hypothetical protein [Bacillus sp. (in: firmicutes)]